MKLPLRRLLKESKNPKALELLLVKAEEALRTWEATWTPFVSAPIREEALEIFNSLNDLHCFADGGFPGAERQRLLFKRKFEGSLASKKETPPISGLNIEGNFLFDNPSPKDFESCLIESGIPNNKIGDIWVTGDRGAQLVCYPETALLLDNKESIIRDIKIRYKFQEIHQLRLPIKRIAKKLTSVEASTRLDAIASAGFGLSRAKVIKKIKDNQVRLNWMPINQASKGLSIGDSVQLEGKGSIQILSLELTKRERWRVVMLRE